MKTGQKIGNDTVVKINHFSVVIRLELRITLIRPSYKVKRWEITIYRGV